MQSDGTESHAHSWKRCMTLHHMCTLLKSAGVTIRAARWALHVGMHFFFQILPTFYSSAPPSPPFLFLSVFVCACVHLTSIWWIKSNALILSQTRPLLHVRSEMPCVRNCIHPHVIQGDGKQWNNRVLSADPRLPQNQQAVIRPPCSSDVAVKTLK